MTHENITVKFLLRMPAELRHRLKIEAARQDRDMTAIVLEAIGRMLGDAPIQAAAQVQPVKPSPVPEPAKSLAESSADVIAERRREWLAANPGKPSPWDNRKPILA